MSLSNVVTSLRHADEKPAELKITKPRPDKPRPDKPGKRNDNSTNSSGSTKYATTAGSPESDPVLPTVA